MGYHMATWAILYRRSIGNEGARRKKTINTYVCICECTRLASAVIHTRQCYCQNSHTGSAFVHEQKTT